MALMIVQGNVVQLRTIAFGRKFAGPRVNNPLLAPILQNSPVQPFYKGDKGSRRDVIQIRELREYARKLSEAPGRRVHLAISSSGELGGVILDFLVFGDNFQFVAK
jgi:hypothetical protein